MTHTKQRSQARNSPGPGEQTSLSWRRALQQRTEALGSCGKPQNPDRTSGRPPHEVAGPGLRADVTLTPGVQGVGPEFPFCRPGAGVQPCLGLGDRVSRSPPTVPVYACYLKIVIYRAILHLQKGLPVWAVNYKVTYLSTSYSKFRRPPEGRATSSQAEGRSQFHKPLSVQGRHRLREVARVLSLPKAKAEGPYKEGSLAFCSQLDAFLSPGSVDFRT